MCVSTLSCCRANMACSVWRLWTCSGVVLPVRIQEIIRILCGHEALQPWRKQWSDMTGRIWACWPYEGHITHSDTLKTTIKFSMCMQTHTYAHTHWTVGPLRERSSSYSSAPSLCSSSSALINCWDMNVLIWTLNLQFRSRLRAAGPLPRPVSTAPSRGQGWQSPAMLAAVARIIYFA